MPQSAIEELKTSLKCCLNALDHLQSDTLTQKKRTEILDTALQKMEFCCDGLPKNSEFAPHE